MTRSPEISPARTTDGFTVHTDAMHAHAGRLRAAAARFGSAAGAAARASGSATAFGMDGHPLAATVLALADRTADGLAAHAAVVRGVADGVDVMAATYRAAERVVRDGFRP